MNQKDFAIDKVFIIRRSFFQLKTSKIAPKSTVQGVLIQISSNIKLASPNYLLGNFHIM